MSLSLACQCGTRFDVEDTYAGQMVVCPECGKSLKAVATPRAPTRTSGHALAAFVIALAAGFTFIGPVVAILFALVAYAKIAGSRGRLVGYGFATAGILFALAFGGLSLLSLAQGDMLDIGARLREQMFAGKLDYGGPDEYVREEDGFAITRPSRLWGVPKPEFAGKLRAEGFMLICPSKDLVVQVLSERGGFFQMDRLEDNFRAGNAFGKWRARGGTILRKQIGGHDAMEGIADLKEGPHKQTAVIRVIHTGDRVYTLWGITSSRRFEDHEAELRRALDSFRVLADRPRNPP